MRFGLHANPDFLFVVLSYRQFSWENLSCTFFLVKSGLDAGYGNIHLKIR